MAVVEREVQVVNALGLHARPAAAFVKVAARFSAEIQVSKDGDPVNAKSILGVMTLAAEQGSMLTIRADGPDAGDAVDALVTLVENGFHE